MSLYTISGIILITSALSTIVITSYTTLMWLVIVFVYYRTKRTDINVSNVPVIHLNDLYNDDMLEGTTPIIYDAMVDEDISDIDTNVSDSDNYHRNMHDKYFSSHDTTHWVTGFTSLNPNKPPKK